MPLAPTKASTFSSSSPLADKLSPANRRNDFEEELEEEAFEEDADEEHTGLPTQHATRWEVLAKRRKVRPDLLFF